MPRFTLAPWSLPILIALTLSVRPVLGGERNRPVPDVVGQFLALKHHGEWLGFHKNGFPLDLGSKRHWQGIQRHPEPGTPILYMTASSNESDVDTRAFVAIVAMGSREPAGERMRSNRLVHGAMTKDSLPPGADRIVKVHTFPYYSHAGGPQMVGTVLAVPLEEVRDGAPEGTPLGVIVFLDVSDPINPAQIGAMEFDHKVGVIGITDLPDGRYLLAVTGTDGKTVRFFRSNGSDFRAEGFAFQLVRTFEANQLQAPAGHYWPWQIAFDLPFDIDPQAISTHQMLNFVKQQNAGGFRLFLLGTHNASNYSPLLRGPDVAMLYEVTGYGDSQTLQLNEVEGQHLFTTAPGSRAADSLDGINFNAGVGTYVSPTGELILYASGHYDKGPGDTIDLAEFRINSVYRPGSPNHRPFADPGGPYRIVEGSTAILDGSRSHPAAARPWVELYANPLGTHDDSGLPTGGWAPEHAWMSQPYGTAASWTFTPPDNPLNGDDGPDRSLVVDAADSLADDYHHFGALDGDPVTLNPGFHDTASALRWWAPPGCRIYVHEDDADDGFGRRLELSDRVFPGFHLAVGAITSLGDEFCNPGGCNLMCDVVCDDQGCQAQDCTGANDKASAVVFDEGCVGPPPVLKFTWSTDVAGSVGGLRDGSGPVAEFEAVDDGAGLIKLDVCQADDWCSGGSTPVTVVNAAPTVAAGSDIAADEGDAVTLIGSFEDKGRLDTHKVEWDFGDGGHADTLSAVHAYVDDGSYAAGLTVTDDDGGVGTDGLGVKVSNVAPVVTGTVQPPTSECRVDTVTLSASFTDPGVLDTHTGSIAWGDDASEAAAVQQGAGGGSFTAGHVYSQPGPVSVAVTVRDDDGGVGSLALPAVVVDTTPPVVVVAPSRVLWPPDHKYVTLTLSECAQVSDR